MILKFFFHLLCIALWTTLVSYLGCLAIIMCIGCFHVMCAILGANQSYSGHLFVLSAAEDTFEHVASVLVNISKVESGRKILLEPKRGLLKQAICQLDSTNPLRKKGVCMRIVLFLKIKLNLLCVVCLFIFIWY